MKCPAREIMFEKKSRYLGDKWGGEVLEFLDASCGSIFHKKDGWGKKRLQRMYDRTKEIMSGVFVKYLAMDTTREFDREKALEEDRINDTAETAVFAMARELKYCGFDYFAERDRLKYRHKFNDLWHPKDERDMYAVKAGWMDRTQLVVDVYMLTVLIYAREECYYGAERLRDRYERLIRDFHSFLDVFLDPNRNSAIKAHQMSAERQRVLEDLGITLEELNKMNGREIG